MGRMCIRNGRVQSGVVERSDAGDRLRNTVDARLESNSVEENRKDIVIKLLMIIDFICKYAYSSIRW